MNNTTKHYSKISEVKRIGSMVVKTFQNNKKKSVCAGVALTWTKHMSNNGATEDEQWARQENERQTKAIELQVFKAAKEQNQENPLINTINEIKTLLKCTCHLVGDNSKIYQTASIEFDKLKKTLKDQLDSVNVLNLKFPVEDPLKSIIDEKNDPLDIKNELSSFSKLLERIKEFQREESQLQKNFLKDFKITLSEMYRELDSKDGPICLAKLKQINGRWEQKPEKHESFFSSMFTVLTLGVFLNDSSMGFVCPNDTQREQFFVGFSAIKTSEPISSAILQILFNELFMDIEAIKESLEDLKFVDVIPFFTSVFNRGIRQGNREFINAKISKISHDEKQRILKDIEYFVETNPLKNLGKFFEYLKTCSGYFESETATKSLNSSTNLNSTTNVLGSSTNLNTTTNGLSTNVGSATDVETPTNENLFQKITNWWHGDYVSKNDPFYKILKTMEANNSLWRLTSLSSSTTKDN